MSDATDPSKNESICDRTKMNTFKMPEIHDSNIIYLHASRGLITGFQAVDGFMVYNQSRLKTTSITFATIQWTGCFTQYKGFT